MQNKNEEIEGWAGLDPSRSPGALYPNEVASCSFFFVCVCVCVNSFLDIDKKCLPYQVISDFAFLPFGGGPRKCVGDQFALMECTVALTLLLQNFDVELNRWN